MRLLRSGAFWGTLLVLALIGALLWLGLRGERLLLWWEEARAGRIAQEEVPAGPPEEPPPAEPELTREILLFFEREDNQHLAPEAGTIYELATVADRGKQVIELLIQGPRSPEHAPTLPQGTRLREFFLTEDGTAFADFSIELARRLPGGSTAELNSVYSIVNSLTHNFRQIRRVQILVEGNEIETLAGHLALAEPLTIDYSLVDARVPLTPGPAAESVPAPGEPGSAATPSPASANPTGDDDATP